VEVVDVQCRQGRRSQDPSLELLVRVEQGEEFVITRGNFPVARLVPLDEVERRKRLIATIKAERSRYGGVSQAEVAAWKHEDHKY
jgi:antitoxin (DNA-binding transcriptional repressor) of toxin-antitoxin stability system